MEILSPKNWVDYELLDCGGFEKLERFGQYITIRPEPQAVWDKKLPAGEWKKLAHVCFEPKSSSSGDWQKLKPMPDQWKIRYKVQSSGNPNFKLSPSRVQANFPPKGDKQTLDSNPVLTFRLGLTSFKHVGIFPEQAVNWDYIYESITLLRASAPVLQPGPTPIRGSSIPRFLNLFAYTGAASMAARAAGADVTHVDSVKQVVSWARENMELSNLENIRWVVEDALKFVKREEKRGNKYHGIILDPPAFGHGPSGEKWKLEDNINEMMKAVMNLLDKKHFLLLNTYSLGFSSLIIENLLEGKSSGLLQTGELCLRTGSGSKLPLGVFGRFRNF